MLTRKSSDFFFRQCPFHGSVEFSFLGELFLYVTCWLKKLSFMDRVVLKIKNSKFMTTGGVICLSYGRNEASHGLGRLNRAWKFVSPHDTKH